MMWIGLTWLSGHRQNLFHLFSSAKSHFILQTQGDFKQIKSVFQILYITKLFHIPSEQIIADVISQILFKFRPTKPVWLCIITGVMTCFKWNRCNNLDLYTLERMLSIKITLGCTYLLALLSFVLYTLYHLYKAGHPLSCRNMWQLTRLTFAP